MPKPTRIRSSKKGAAKPRSSFEWGSVKRPHNDSGEREDAFRRAIFAIPPGKVNSYGGVAAAAGYPRYHRAVARLLHQDHLDQLPWHRVLGADGEIKTSGASAREQRARLRAEGVSFEGKRVNRRAFLTLPMIEGENVR
jgi:methylated-DNA-protein-cysteine methyltransferase related protein